MPPCASGRLAGPPRCPRAQFGRQDGLPLRDLPSAEPVAPAFRDAQVRWRERLFSPALTLWAVPSQALGPGGSCRAAGARAVAWLASAGRQPWAATTGASCKARGRLPEAALRRLAHDTGRAPHRQAPAARRRRGRRVKVVDGATPPMPDAPADQQAYPQHNARRPGPGFPRMRVVTLSCPAPGAASRAAPGRYQGQRSGANALPRALGEGLEPGDVVLGEGAFASYLDLAPRRARGGAAVVRIHRGRRIDGRRGRRSGPAGHRVAWGRPERPGWMDAETCARVPEVMEVRAVRVPVRQEGFRTRVDVLAATRLDAAAYPADDLGELYRVRRQAEPPRRSPEVVLGMAVRRCLTPAVVRQEVWAQRPADDLPRTVPAQAAQGHGLEPWQLRVTGALQAALACAGALACASAEALAASSAA